MELTELNGHFITQAHEQYEKSRQIWNAAIDQKPLAIVYCENEEQVVEAVKVAREHGLTISVRSGGHHIAGFAVADGSLTIDVSNIKTIAVDIEHHTITVGAGVKTGELTAEAQKYGLAVPVGTASGTGVTGVALGGGIGYLRSVYGLTCDQIVGARVVNADGEVIIVNETENPELLWALRGGGGNFGVVTELQLKAHPIGTELLVFDLLYDYQDIKQILKRLQAYTEQAPNEALAVNLTVAVLPPAPFLPEFLHFKKVVMVLGAYIGDPQQGHSVIQPLRELATPIVDQTAVAPYLKLQSQLDPMIPPAARCYGTSLFLGDLTAELIDQLVAQMDAQTIPSALIQLWALGGQMNNVTADESAFAIRDSKYVFLVDAMAMNDDDEACVSWVENLYKELSPFSHRNASYLNAFEATETAAKDAYQQNFARLQHVKSMYDPNNIFCHNHNIK